MGLHRRSDWTLGVLHVCNKDPVNEAGCPLNSEWEPIKFRWNSAGGLLEHNRDPLNLEGCTWNLEATQLNLDWTQLELCRRATWAQQDPENTAGSLVNSTVGELNSVGPFEHAVVHLELSRGKLNSVGGHSCTHHGITNAVWAHQPASSQAAASPNQQDMHTGEEKPH